MRFLLDTHVFLWWTEDSPKLSQRVRDIFADDGSEILLSVVSAWEIMIKVGIGKLDLPDTPDRLIPEQILYNGLGVLPLTLQHALQVHSLPHHHRDPFDRMLVAQALAEEVPILTADPRISEYPADVIW